MEKYEQKLWEIFGSNSLKLFKDLCKISWEVDFKGALSGFEDRLEKESFFVDKAVETFASRYGLKMRRYLEGDYNFYFDYEDKTGNWIFAICRDRGETVPEECEYWKGI